MVRVKEIIILRTLFKHPLIPPPDFVFFLCTREYHAMPPTCLLDTYLLIFDHYRPDTFVFLRVFDVASTAYTSGFLLHLLACRFLTALVQ